MGNEVFHFNLDLYPDATEGDSYTDMSKVDGVVSLNVGCIQIVYLHKFLMSFLVKVTIYMLIFNLEILKSDTYDFRSYKFWILGCTLF